MPVGDLGDPMCWFSPVHRGIVPLDDGTRDPGTVPEVRERVVWAAGDDARRARVALRLLTDPRPLPKLWRLRQRVAHASQLLADATESALHARATITQPEARP